MRPRSGKTYFWLASEEGGTTEIPRPLPTSSRRCSCRATYPVRRLTRQVPRFDLSYRRLSDSGEPSISCFKCALGPYSMFIRSPFFPTAESSAYIQYVKPESSL